MYQNPSKSEDIWAAGFKQQKFTQLAILRLGPHSLLCSSEWFQGQDDQEFWTKFFVELWLGLHWYRVSSYQDHLQNFWRKLQFAWNSCCWNPAAQISSLLLGFWYISCCTFAKDDYLSCFLVFFAGWRVTPSVSTVLSIQGLSIVSWR